MVGVKKRKPHSHRISGRPGNEKLTWPGLKAKDHLSRVITRAVKEAKEAKENKEWAENQIARVLDYVPPQTAMRLVFRETCRRRNLTPRLSKLFSDFLRRWGASMESVIERAESVRLEKNRTD
jgi:hypothetical protein